MFIATNPVTKKRFIGDFPSKEEFIKFLEERVCDIAGWYSHELKECLEKDMIEED